MLSVCVCKMSNVSIFSETVTKMSLIPLTEKQTQAEPLSINKYFNNNNINENKATHTC